MKFDIMGLNIVDNIKRVMRVEILKQESGGNTHALDS